MLTYRMANEIIKQIASLTRFISIPHRYMICSIKQKMEACTRLDDRDEKNLHRIEEAIKQKEYPYDCKREARFLTSKKDRVYTEFCSVERFHRAKREIFKDN